MGDSAGAGPADFRSVFRHNTDGTAVAPDRSTRVCVGGFDPCVHKHLITLGCRGIRARAFNSFLHEAQRHHARRLCHALFRTRRCCGASASTAASIIPIIQALARGIPYPYPGLVYPLGVYANDPAVAVRLQVTPRDASVFVDGYAAGTVDDYDGVFQRLRLVPGPHEIVIYHPGHRTLRQHIYYNPGSTHTIRHILEPLLPGETPEPQPVPRALPAYPGTARTTRSSTGRRRKSPARRTRAGTLALRVQPGDATVLVDGEAVARAADAGPARDSARGRAAPRAHREARLPARSWSTSTSAPARRSASTSVCCRNRRSAFVVTVAAHG